MTIDKIFKEAIKKTKTFLEIVKINDEHCIKHGEEVATIVSKCLEIGRKKDLIQWSDEECMDILIGSMIIDSGMAYLPFNLYYAERELTNAEKRIVEMHPYIGQVLAEHANFSSMVQNIILMHHANANGTGYPYIDGRPLISNDILKEEPSNGIVVPDYVWLVIYADRFCALTETKSYRPGFNYAEAWKRVHMMIKDKKISYKYRRIFESFVQNEGFNCKNITVENNDNISEKAS